MAGTSTIEHLSSIVVVWLGILYTPIYPLSYYYTYSTYSGPRQQPRTPTPVAFARSPVYISIYMHYSTRYTSRVCARAGACRHVCLRNGRATPTNRLHRQRPAAPRHPRRQHNLLSPPSPRIFSFLLLSLPRRVRRRQSPRATYNDNNNNTIHARGVEEL